MPYKGNGNDGPCSTKELDHPADVNLLLVREAPVTNRAVTGVLKRAMDRRLDRLKGPRVVKGEFRRLQRAVDRRFDRLERTTVNKAELERAIASLRTNLRGEIVTSAVETRRYVDATADRLGRLRDDIAASAVIVVLVRQPMRL